MTSSTSPVVWYSGGACITLTFATVNSAQPPVSPLWNVDRSETKFTPWLNITGRGSRAPTRTAGTLAVLAGGIRPNHAPVAAAAGGRVCSPPTVDESARVKAAKN